MPQIWDIILGKPLTFSVFLFSLLKKIKNGNNSSAYLIGLKWQSSKTIFYVKHNNKYHVDLSCIRNSTKHFTLLLDFCSHNASWEKVLRFYFIDEETDYERISYPRPYKWGLAELVLNPIIPLTLGFTS